MYGQGGGESPRYGQGGGESLRYVQGWRVTKVWAGVDSYSFFLLGG